LEETLKSLGSRSCVVLASTTLSVLAWQQCLAFDALSARPGDGQIILAQAPDPKDPKAKKPAPAAATPVKPAVQPIVPPRNLQAVQPPTQPRVIAPVQPVQPKIQPVQPAVGARQVKPVTPTDQSKITPTPVEPKKLQGGQPPTVGARQIQPVNPKLQPVNPTGQPTPAARNVGPKEGQPIAAVKNVDQLRAQRKVEMVGNQKILVEPDKRMIVRDGKKAFIRHDENSRFRLLGVTPRMEQRGNEHFAYIKRPGGYQIISVTDGSGRLLQRIRRGPDGRDVILINNRRGAALAAGAGAGLAAALFLGLAAPVIHIPRDEYIVDVSAARADMLYDALDAEPLEPMERAYSLDEIRYNVELRDRLRRLDVDSITFASGAWEITPEQYPALEAVAHAMKRVLSRNPNAMFLIEGHTDGVGNEDDNLSLSDRRAEAVAVVLTDAFQIPPENLVTQGYGEQFLKVPTDGPNRSNRRVTVRNIFRLLAGS
jgi:outer membrane protein OmpA-like peptidoglycan-associated protein